MEQREKLIAYAVKYQGNYNKIRQAYESDENIEMNIVKYPAITIIDDIYPERLKELVNPPYVLFYKGNIDLLNTESVSVVGSRKISEYGKQMTELIVKSLKDKYTMVSGLAVGVDACVHQNSINDKTIGILGCGIDYVYPKANQYLFDKMSKNQLIISEYPGNTVPQKYYFPFRNRIISALGKVVIVTQARKHSGTMHTVNEALDLCRDIYVVPYKMDDTDGDGCNELIQQGANILLVEDIKCL